LNQATLLKNVFSRPLLKRIGCKRHFEGYVRACRYNIRQLMYIYYVNGVDVKWLNNKIMNSSQKRSKALNIYGKYTKINIYQNSKQRTRANFNEVTKVTYE